MKSVGWLVRFDKRWMFTPHEPIHIPPERKREIISDGEGVELL